MSKGAYQPGCGLPPGEYESRQAERRLGRFCLQVALVGFLCGLYAAQPVLVRRLRLQGCRTLSEATVRQYTDVLLGQHWAVARTRPVQRRLQALPGIKDVRLRRWPFQEITVSITERKPRAMLSSRTGLLLVDDEGVLFEPPDGPLPKCPALSGKRLEGARLGGRLEAEDLGRVLDCLRSAQEAELPAPSRVVLDGNGGLTLYTAGPLCIHLGRQDLQEKLLLAKYAVESLRAQRKPVASLDLRTLDCPTWSPHLS